MIRKIFLLGITILGCVAGPLTLAAGAMLRDVQLDASSDGAQLQLDLSRVTSYKLFTLDNPARVVVDLSDTRLSGAASLPKSDGVVSAVRTGVQPKQTLRVVLQLKKPMAVRGSWSDETGKTSRLVVQLGEGPGATGEAPEAAEVSDSAALAAVRAAHAPEDTGRSVVIAIDAGHGGQDPGAIGRGGTREKDVVLAIARSLARKIDAERGMRAVLTRDSDQFLTLRQRIARARAAKADLFVSVHADSVHNRDVSGASVYVLSERGASSEAARWLAERENAADLMGGVKLDDKDNVLASVLLDLSQSANIDASMTAAQRVLGSLHTVGAVRKPRVQQAGFVVLKSPDIPSMLIETAYISNPGDEKRLKARSHQEKLASAIATGLRNYFEQNPPAGTRFAQARRAAGAGVLAGY